MTPIIVEWDYKSNPDVKAINDAIRKIYPARASFCVVNTDSDSFAFVIGDEMLNQRYAQQFYDEK